MGKAETIVKDLGDNLAEAVGVRDGTDAGLPVPGPLDNLTRLKGAGQLPIDDVLPDPNNPRTEWDEVDLALLADSIRQRGILQPIRTRWDETLGKHVITVGERRFRAAQLAGLTQIPVICSTEAITEVDILTESIQENLLRSSLSAIDEARAYQRYMQLTGCTAKSLAALICVSQASISKALSLLNLPAEVQDAVSEGKISPKTGQVISRIKNPEVAKRVAAKAAETKAHAKEVEQTVRQRRGVQAKATLQQPFTQFKVRRGCRIVIHGKLTGREIVDALEAATLMAKAALRTIGVDGG